VVFAKHYYYGGSSGELVAADVIKPISWNSSSFGAGDALRVHATDWLTLKASYEYATRLPRPDEVFGNGVLIRENLTLEPELSHNANLGPRFDVKAPWLGSLAVEANAFLRDSDKLIVLLGQTMFLQYQNVVHARSLGAEGQLAWSSPDEWVNVHGSMTFQDVRNVSPTGIFARYDGDRIPNRPWLFGSWGASVRWKHVIADDVLEPYYEGRYVHSFFRTWESVGLGGAKQEIPMQVTHAVGLSYAINVPFGRFSASFEGQNLGDARVYDVFGVQKPGRAFYFKLTAELR
jgi:vitamin B12 transporter